MINIRTIIFYMYCIWALFITSVFSTNKMRRWIKEGNSKKIDDFFVKEVYYKKVTNILRICGVTFEVTGTENVPSDGSVVFISNHQGNFDVITLVNVLNRKISFIAKKELRKVPFLGEWMANMGCLFIDRGNIKQSAKIIIEAIEYIKAGNAMTIFPEGTRSKGGSVGEFKAGSFKLAIKSGSTVIPISIEGSYKVMEANKGKIRPAKIKIKVHEPIETKTMNKEQQNELHNKVRDIIVNGLKEINYQ